MRLDELAARIGSEEDFAGQRLVVYIALGEPYRESVQARAAECPRSPARVIALADAPIPDVDTVLISPEDEDDRAVLIRAYKIAFPLLFPRARASLVLDADIRVQREAHFLESAFTTAERLGMLLSAHPIQAWPMEPWAPGQREEYQRRGLTIYQPLWMAGAVLRAHDHIVALSITQKWYEEFLRYPSRAQTALLMAVYEAGVSPVTATPAFLSYDAFNKRSLLWHMPQATQIPRFFYKEFAGYLERKEDDLGVQRACWETSLPPESPHRDASPCPDPAPDRPGDHGDDHPHPEMGPDLRGRDADPCLTEHPGR